MTLRCAILDDYQNVACTIADWSPLDGRVVRTVFNAHIPNRDELKRTLHDFEIVVAMRERTPFDRDLIEALPNLKLLITTGMANKSIDLAACKPRVVVCGTRGVGNPTTGVTFGLMLELTRRIGFENARMKSGQPWQATIGPDLEGLTLGIIGLGRLGKRVAGVAKAFGMKVIAWSQNLTTEVAAAEGVGYADKEGLLRTADIVTIHLQLGDRSRGLLGKSDLAMMKQTSFLINASRGPIVDEAALIEALTKKQIAGAGLDVFATEPLPVSHPFRTLDNVVISPHLGYVTTQNYARFYADVVEDIRAFLSGEPVRVIN